MGAAFYPDSPPFWPSGKAGSAGRLSAATARQRADAAATRRQVAAIDERARGGGAAGWWPCGGCSAREASAEAAISESEKQRRTAAVEAKARRETVGNLGHDEQGEDGEGVERVRQRLQTRGASPAVLHSRPPLPRPRRRRRGRKGPSPPWVKKSRPV